MIRYFTLLAAAVLGTHLAAQEPEKPKTVTLRWYGQSFFQLETSSQHKIVFDPHAIPAFGIPRVKADFVLITHPHTDHSQIEVLDGTPKPADVYRGVIEPKPGRQEWKEIDEKRGPIRIRTLGTYHDAVGGLQRGK